LRLRDASERHALFANAANSTGTGRVRTWYPVHTYYKVGYRTVRLTILSAATNYTTVPYVVVLPRAKSRHRKTLIHAYFLLARLFVPVRTVCKGPVFVVCRWQTKTVLDPTESIRYEKSVTGQRINHIHTQSVSS
jgi:hypothetical protein